MKQKWEGTFPYGNKLLYIYIYILKKGKVEICKKCDGVSFVCLFFKLL